MTHKRKNGEETAFTPEESQAWQYLEEFIHGGLHAQSLAEAKAAHRAVGEWLEQIVEPQ